MRTRISSAHVNGKLLPVIKYKTFFGEHRTAVLATSETPQHAKSNIHKVLAHKKVLMYKNRINPMPCRNERRETFFALGKTQYKAFYLN